MTKTKTAKTTNINIIGRCKEIPFRFRSNCCCYLFPLFLIYPNRPFYEWCTVALRFASVSRAPLPASKSKSRVEITRASQNYSQNEMCIFIVPNSFKVRSNGEARGTEETINGECLYEKHQSSVRTKSHNYKSNKRALFECSKCILIMISNGR